MDPIEMDPIEPVTLLKNFPSSVTLRAHFFVGAALLSSSGGQNCSVEM